MLGNVFITKKDRDILKHLSISYGKKADSNKIDSPSPDPLPKCKKTSTLEELVELDECVEMKKRLLHILNQTLQSKFNWDIIHTLCKKPFLKNPYMRDPSMCEDDDAPQNILTMDMIAARLSNISECPIIGKQVFTTCNLSRMGLFDIELLEKFKYIQCLDISFNLLVSLKHLDNFHFLRYLDASNNLIQCLFDFNRPYYIRGANYSHNKIETIKDISHFWTIVSLDLSHNNIHKIEGLESLRFLQKLNLSFNYIDCLENLNGLPINNLNVSQNNISQFQQETNKGLHTLKNLYSINLDNNKIKTLKIFKCCTGIQEISMKYNKVEHMFDLPYYVRDLKNLKILDLSFNPITYNDKMINVCCLLFPKIEILNGVKVSDDLKECNPDFHSNELIEKAKKTIVNLTHFEIMNPPKYQHCVDFLEKLYAWPLVVLAGPQKCAKGELCHRISEKHCDKVYYAFLHTTKPIILRNPMTRNYHHVTQQVFSEMIKHNHFFTYWEINGDSFGLSFAEVKNAMKKHKLLISHLAGVAALTLQARSKQTYIIATLKQDIEQSFPIVINQSQLSLRKCIHEINVLSKAEIDKILIDPSDMNSYTESSNELTTLESSDNYLNVRKSLIIEYDDYKPVNNDNLLHHREELIQPKYKVSIDSFFSPDKLKAFYSVDPENSDPSMDYDINSSKCRTLNGNMSTSLDNTNFNEEQHNKHKDSLDSNIDNPAESLKTGCLQESSSQNICCAEINSCEALIPKIINLTFFEPYEPKPWNDTTLLPEDCVELKCGRQSSYSFFSPEKIKKYSKSMSETSKNEGISDTTINEKRIDENSVFEEYVSSSLNDIQKDTNALLRIHHNFPEIFYDMIYTDNLEDAYKKIETDIIKLHLKHFQKKLYPRK